MERQSEEVRGRQVRRLVVGAWLLSVVVLGGAAVSQAAEPTAAPTNAGPSMPQQPNQERFLQNFISQSLGQGPASPTTPPAPPSLNSQPSGASPQAPALSPQPQPASSTGDLTAAALKMVLSLTGILLLLVLGGYVIRRYLLDQTFLGKRNALMRVLARINITPKAGVALLEVPGKVLVIGITGSTLVALGELTPVTTAPLEQPLSEPLSSFATTLDTSIGSPTDEGKPADVLLKVSEVIQQKMSRLKQL